jgi:hypothetical protein
MEFLGARQRVGQVIAQAVPGGQHVPDPLDHVPGQLARDVGRAGGQVLDLIEEIVEVRGIGVPAVVRIALPGLTG